MVGFTLCIIIGCRSNSQREALLKEREDALAGRQAAFVNDCRQYQQLEKIRDSLNALMGRHVIHKWPDQMAGTWRAKLICNNSDQGSWVVGDRLSQTWQFVNTPVGIFVYVSDDNRLVRVLSADLDNNQVHLHFMSGVNLSRRVEVELLRTDTAGCCSLTGHQICSFGEHGQAVFSVELTAVANF